MSLIPQLINNLLAEIKTQIPHAVKETNEDWRGADISDERWTREVVKRVKNQVDVELTILIETMISDES